MTAVNDFNRNLIAEFRSGEGKVRGAFEGAPLLLLTTTGAKTGRRRFAEYEAKTERQIPVIALERVSS